MTRPIILALLLSAATTLAQAPQPPAARPGDIAGASAPFNTISGRVTAADTGLPLARVQMHIVGAAWDRTTATDEQGRYAFRDLPPGRFRVIASRAGYVTISYGQRVPYDPIPMVTVIANQANDHIDFALSKSAAIVVQVLDEFGEPAEGIAVQVYRFQFVNGQPQLTPYLERMVTDDRGLRRVFGLPPGEFAVAAGLETIVTRGTTRWIYERTFYPGTSEEKQVQPIPVAAGQDVGVSVAMRPPVVGPPYVVVRGFDTPPPEALVAPPTTPAPPPGATAIITGTVRTDAGVPLAHARVMLHGRLESVAIADAGGRYAFEQLPAGRYTLSASKAGYLLLQYGRRRIAQPSRPIDLEAAARLEAVDFALPKAGAIGVAVTNEMGEPLPDVRVTIRQYRFLDGERRFGAAWQSINGEVKALATSQSDDLGQVRVGGLAPGEYYVEADAPLPSPPHPPTDFVTPPAPPPATPGLLSTGHEETMFAETYYPGTLYVTDAVPLGLKTAEETRVVMPLAVTRAGSISGVISTDDGSPPAWLRLTLDARPVPLLPDGTYRVERVAGGEHVLAVVPMNLNVQPQYARRLFRTTGDDARIDITASSGWALRGRIEFEGGAPPGPPPTTFPLDNRPLRSEDAAPFRLKLSADWTFEYAGLRGPRLLALPDQARPAEIDYVGWWIKRMMIGDEDVTDRPIDPRDRREINDLRIVLSRDTRASVSGNVVDGQDRPVADYTVVLFPEDPALWTRASRLLVTGRPDQRGRFEVRNLPPGRYLAAAIDTVAAGEERDPALLTRLKEFATLVTLGNGEELPLRLRMSEP